MIVALLALAGCGTTITRTDRALFDIRTNYVPVVHVFTNTVQVTNTVTLTNTVKEIVEKPAVVRVTNDVGTVNITTNIHLTTNITLVTVVSNYTAPAITVSSETNLVAHDVTVKPKAGVETGVGLVGGLAGNAAGGMGALVSGLAVGALGLWARQRQRAINNGLRSDLEEHEGINALLTQSIEVGRELLKTTPQGQRAEAVYREWLKQNQSAAGVIATVSKIVEDNVDNEAAKTVAQMIAPNRGGIVAAVAPAPGQPAA